MQTLGLTTTAWRSFYRQQEAAVDAVGIDYDTLEVPGDHRAFDDGVRRRTALDYARFYPQVLRQSLAGYDLLHANYGLTLPFAVCQPHLPVVASLWGGEFIGNRFAPVIRACVKRADAVVVPSEPMVERLPASVHGRTHVVPFPVDTDEFCPRPREEAREAIGWNTDRDVVLFPYAEARHEKNYALAERVVEGLNGDVELRSVANEPYERMPDYLNASDALLVTSRWESGPMSVKEALACNLPVVSRPVGFVPNVLDGVPNTHVGATERELRRGLRNVFDTDGEVDGRQSLESYGPAEMGDRIRTVYEQCLGN